MNPIPQILLVGLIATLPNAHAVTVILGDSSGDARGEHAIDIQSFRGSSSQVASGAHSVAVGKQVTTSGSTSMGFGINNIVSGFAGVGIGLGNFVGGSESFAAGHYNSVQSGTYAILLGTENISNGDHTLGLGYYNIVAAETVAIGFCNSTTGVGYAFGYDNVVAGGDAGAASNYMTYDPSAAFGMSNQILAGANNSMAFGRSNVVSASNTSVFGANIVNATANSTMIGPSDAAKVTILSSGNVGIGTATPTSKLHVVGDLNVTGSVINSTLNGSGSGSTTRLRVGGTATPGAAWQGTTVVGADGQNKIITGYLTSSTNGAVIGAHNSALTAWADLNIAGANLIFRTNETEQMRISNSGNVGIGTNAPQSKLTVATGGVLDTGGSSDRAQYVTIAGPGKAISSGTNSGQLGIFATDSGPVADAGGSIALGAIYNTSNHMAMNAAIKSGRDNASNGNYGGYLSFFTRAHGAGATERIRIASTGNVGIGTPGSSAKLDVNGPSGVTSFTGTTRLGITVRGSVNNSDYSGIDFSGNSTGSGDTPTARIATVFTSAGSKLQFGTSGSYVSGVTNTAMTIDPAGNVGIGTTTPDPSSKLDVAGNVKVSGSLTVGGSPVVTSTGNGGGLTGLNATQVTTGTLPAARLPSEAVQLASTQTLTNKTLSGAKLTGATAIGGAAVGNQMVITSSGAVGLGRNPDPGVNLDVNGEAVFRGGITVSGGFSSDGAFINYGGAGVLEQVGTSDLWLGGGQTLSLSASSTLHLNSQEIRVGPDFSYETRLISEGDSATYQNLRIKPYGTGTVIVEGKTELQGTIIASGDIKIKNNAVIRVSPAGDIDMGSFTSGSNPAN